jgi:cytochrome c oxidase subunit 2
MILGIFLVLFRVQSLVGVLRGSTRRVGLSNQINGALMLIVPLSGLLIGIWYSPIAAKHFLPEAASVHGKETDHLFWITLAIIIAMFLVTNAFLFWFAFQYQYKEGRKVVFYADNHKLELIWTAVPAVIMTVLVLYGALVWNRAMMQTPPKDVQKVEIMGKQFAWQVRYPGKDGVLGKYDFRLINDSEGNEFGIDFEDKASEDDFIPRELHLQVNKPVLLKIRARDVLHSVFLPHFRVKMDAVPGMPTQFMFTPTKTTAEMRAATGNPNFNYELACTEICGKGHFAMRYIVVVDDEVDYKKWVAEQKPFLEEKPEFKGKGMKALRKKNVASTQEKDSKKQNDI